MEFREPMTINPFAIVSGLNAQLPITVNSSYFTVKSTGEVGGAKRTIIAVLQRQGLNVVTVTWNEVRGGL